LPSLFTRMTEYQASGCLKVISGSSAWLFFLRQGKLLYASSSIDPFGRLNRHIRRLSIQVPTLVSAVRVQLRLLFDSPALETGSANGSLSLSHELAQSSIASTLSASRDYRAICWLVEQRHLAPKQAAGLIEDMAKEVIGTVLSVSIDRYELIEPEEGDTLSPLCDLELEALMAQSQAQPLQRTSDPVVQPFHSRGLSRGVSAERNAPTPEVMSTNSRSQSAPQSIPQAVPRTAHTIACIDDSPSILAAITNFLSDKGISVIPINDPVKALMQIIRNKPDLILLDVTMPNLDGYELCSLLRKHPHFKSTPVVMVTSNTGFIDRAKAKLVGASGYMTKPFTETDLMKMVFKHLS
jgi:two-component system, chemotaxis family, response regulator PixG